MASQVLEGSEQPGKGKNIKGHVVSGLGGAGLTAAAVAFWLNSINGLPAKVSAVEVTQAAHTEQIKAHADQFKAQDKRQDEMMRAIERLIDAETRDIGERERLTSRVEELTREIRRSRNVNEATVGR